LPATGPPTILFEVFWTQQKRKRLVEVALEGTELPPDDYPFYVTIGADGPLTPTALAELLVMPIDSLPGSSIWGARNDRTSEGDAGRRNNGECAD